MSSLDYAFSVNVQELLERCVTVNAFVGPDARGNPAGVLVSDRELPAAEMQTIAREMGHAETAFLVRTGPGRFGLRWFAPEAEVPLCGHATLASAWALWNVHGERSPQFEFSTKSGILRASRVGEEVELDFPADHSEPWELPGESRAALGVRNIVATERSNRTGKIVIELPSPADVRGIRPDFGRLHKALPNQIAGVVVTAHEGQGFDFVSRFFDPWVGVDEDPVTGSAHCVLATYWSKRLGKKSFDAFQASARGGVLGVTLRDDGRVRLRGRARLG